MEKIINSIPFFKNKEAVIQPNIYLNDKYPSCFLVISEGIKYKVRIPSKLNISSVENEINSIKLLKNNSISNIPKIINYGFTLGSNIPYVIESYENGESIDKIHYKLTIEDWKHITNQIYNFLISIHKIKNTYYGKLGYSHKKYFNYGLLLRDRIIYHLNNCINNSLLTMKTIRKIKSCTNNIDSFFSEEITFLHFDIKPQNIIYDINTKTINFIDFEHSRYGAISHELYRIDTYSNKYPYFKNCWINAKNKYLNSYVYDNKDIINFYYELFFYISELTYLNFIKDKINIELYVKKINEKLQQI